MSKRKSRIRELQEKFGFAPKQQVGFQNKQITKNITGGFIDTTDKKTTTTTKTWQRKSKIAQLRFSPIAWAKLIYIRDLGNTEVGFFGISDIDDMLCVKDIAVIKQKASTVTIDFDTDWLVNWYDDQRDLGLQPVQYGRIWIHTHPASSATPSSTDEKTFADTFEGYSWAVMAIVARGGETYARLKCLQPTEFEIEISVVVDYSLSFDASKHEEWKKEYEELVKKEVWTYPNTVYYGEYDGASGKLYTSPKNPYNTSKIQQRWNTQDSIKNEFWWEDDEYIGSDWEEEEKEDQTTVYPRQTLRSYLNKLKAAERVVIMQQLELQEDEIGDYVCYLDEKDTLHAEMVPLDEVEIETASGGWKG